MKNLIINTPNGTAFFAIFYLLAFLVSFAILIVEGRRRKFPTLPWLVVIATGFVFFVLGCRIVTFSATEWEAVLNNQHPKSNGLVMLGGLLLSVPAILVAKRLFRLDASMLDAYAFVLPVAMFVQRIGCFLNGCCFGSPTTGWGVQYRMGTSPYSHHLLDGSLSSAATHSLSIHPVQLYESAGCLIAAFVLLKVRRKFKSTGSLYYASGLSYYAVRFVAEFFRDPSAYAIRVTRWHGLNIIQWLMLMLIIGSIIIITVKERSTSNKPQSNIASSTPRNVFCFFILALAFLFVSRWLSSTEVLVVYLALFTTGGYLTVELFKSITVPQLRIASLSLLLVSLCLMSQTYPELPTDSTRISYNTISVGVLAGNQNYIIGTKTTTDCSGGTTTIPEHEYNNDYSFGAVGFARTTQKANSTLTYGINVFKGKHHESGLSTSNHNIYGVNPYFQADWQPIGFGVGAHMGDFTLIPKDNQTSFIDTKNFFPQIYFRFGRLNKIFGEFSVARNFPGSFPGNYFQADLGFGLNKKHRYKGAFKIGTSTSTAIFFSSTHLAGKHIIIEPYVGLGPSFMTDVSYDEATAVLAAINLHYKFNKKTRP